MKVIMENWNKFVKEGDEVVIAVNTLLENYHRQVAEGAITQEVLNEGLRDELHLLMKKYGKKAIALALAGTLGFAASQGLGGDEAEPERITTVSPAAADFEE